MNSNEWNARYPVGQRVIVQMDDGEKRETKTLRPAERLPSGHDVIRLEGCYGPYLLNRIYAIEKE